MFEIQGVYQVYYSAGFGSGFGQFLLKSGAINGSDIGFGEYRGKYWYDRRIGEYILDIELVLSAPNYLVTDGIPRQSGSTFKFRVPMSEEKLDKPFRAELPTGPVILTISRISNLHRDAA